MLQFQKSIPHITNSFDFLLPISTAKVMSTYQPPCFSYVHLLRCNHPSAINFKLFVVSRKQQAHLLHLPFRLNARLQLIAAVKLVSNSHHHSPQNLQDRYIQQSR
jgi:hypothetical protein